MNNLEKIPGFGASDPTDNRKLLQWQSRYPPEATKEIRFEAVYLGCLLLAMPWLLLGFFCHSPYYFWKFLDPSIQKSVSKYGLAWIGGTLGGTLFTIKWLYHVVARELWNLDRRLWRIFAPHISGGLAFAVIALVSSGMLKIFDVKATNSPSVVIGMAFLVGYFSDTAAAKLAEIAQTLFGTSRSEEKHVAKPTVDTQKSEK
jgi:hypothetical protein